MRLQELVLIDTCVWVEFFNRPQSQTKALVDRVLDDDRAALIGPILAEVLVGFRRNAEADWVASLLRGARYLDVDWEDWRMAAQLGRRLAPIQERVPLSDLVLAAVAARRDCAVFTSDPHFDLFPEIKRFSPTG